MTDTMTCMLSSTFICKSGLIEESEVGLKMIGNEYSRVDRQTFVFQREERSNRTWELPDVETVHQPTSGSVEQ